jgi:hypothetical protein
MTIRSSALSPLLFAVLGVVAIIDISKIVRLGFLRLASAPQPLFSHPLLYFDQKCMIARQARP